MTPSPHQSLQLRQQHHAFLLMRVGAGDHRRCRTGAGVEGEVAHVGGDVEDVSCDDCHRVYEIGAGRQKFVGRERMAAAKMYLSGWKQKKIIKQCFEPAFSEWGLSGEGPL